MSDIVAIRFKYTLILYNISQWNQHCSIEYRYGEVVLKCWELKPENRPHFSDLVRLVASLLASNAGYLSFSGKTILKEMAAAADASTMETTVAVCGDDKSIQIMDTGATDEMQAQAI